MIAFWGAILSTVIAVRQFLSERVRVRLTVGRNRQMVGYPRYQNTVLMVLTVTNIGRRPVTITSFGAVRLYPNTGLAAVDTEPPLPCEITEGRYIMSIRPQEAIDFSTIDYWAAWDSHGRIHRLQEASLLRHLKSTFQLKKRARHAV